MYDRKSNFKYKYTIRAVGGSENPEGGGEGGKYQCGRHNLPPVKKNIFFQKQITFALLIFTYDLFIVEQCSIG